jgi:hypothetical protein
LPTGTFPCLLLFSIHAIESSLTSFSVIPLYVDVASEEMELPPVPAEVIDVPVTELPYPEAVTVVDDETEASSGEGHSNSSSPSPSAADAEAHLLLERAGEALVCYNRTN